VRLFGMPEGVKAVREFSFASAPHEAEIWFVLMRVREVPIKKDFRNDVGIVLACLKSKGI